MLFYRLLATLAVTKVFAEDKCGSWHPGLSCKDDHDCCPSLSGLTCDQRDKKCVWKNMTNSMFTCEDYIKLTKWMVEKVTDIGCGAAAKVACVAELGSEIAIGCEVIGFGPENPLTWVCTGIGEGAVAAACTLACSMPMKAAEKALIDKLAPQCNQIPTPSPTPSSRPLPTPPTTSARHPDWERWPTPEPVAPTPYPVPQPNFNPTSIPLFKCYHYTDVDLEMDLPEEERCMTAGFGFLYTRGDESLAPGCGDCYCCQPVNPPALQFQCYQYTTQDWEEKEHFGWTEEELCTQYTGWGHVFANGDMSVAPGCGRCDCCVPDVPTPERYECYHYTEDDLLYQQRLGLSDARMCFTAGLGFGYQDSEDAVNIQPYPGCDYPCECCRPVSGTFESTATDSGHLVAPPPSSSKNIALVEAPISGSLDDHAFTCYHYTTEDLAMTSIPESERCLTAGWGFVYTGGDASLAPGCGRCSCCQPVNKVETPSDRCFSCYHYTNEDWRLVEAGIMSERDMCKTRGQGFLYTQGNDSIAPGCDRCWCCQPEPTC